MTSIASCVNGQADISLLTFVILVSDSLRFATVLSEPLFIQNVHNDDYKQVLDNAYAQLQEKLATPMTMMFTYAPFVQEVLGQDITTHLAQISNNVPLFGALACDHTSHSQDSYILYNGISTKNSLVLLGITGSVRPKFFFASLLPDSIQNKKSYITASDENIVHYVNDMPVLDYIHSLGLTVEAWEEAGAVIPFLVDYNDGSPMVARELLGVTQEHSVIFGGEMPVGGQLHLALQSPEGILQSATLLLEKVIEQKNTINSVFIVNCVGRSLILGSNALAEAQKTIEVLGNDFPYHLVYARGEICPTYVPSGQSQNRFHNFSFVICIFENN